MTATARRGTVPLEPGASVPTWIDTSHGALAAHVHAPYGAACRGAAILLSPFGPTEAAFRPALRHLADLLARRGCVVIRADWSGTVESAAAPDDGAVPPMARRLGDVTALARHARRELGQEEVVLVGVGLGGTLAALAMNDPQGPRRAADGRSPYRAVVLVDPWPRRGSWIRLPEGRSDAAADTRVLVVGREDAPLDRAVADFAGRVRADLFDAVDLGALGTLEPRADDGPLPQETWDVVADWLAVGTHRPTPVPVLRSRRRARVAPGVVEEYVDVDGLPGVLTGPTAPPAHAVLLVSDDGDDRRGPGGDGWVRLARAAARDGLATLRIDRAGVGETRDPGRQGAAAAPVASPGNVADHVGAARWLAARTACRPSIAGHGAGAWVALRVAAEVPMTRVVSIAQELWTTAPEQPGELGPWLFAHLPYPIVLRLGRTRALPTPQPLIEAATALGAAVDLYGDPRHAALFDAARGADALDRLGQSGASVRRYTERTPVDLRDPRTGDIALGRVLGRLLRDLPDGADRHDPRAAGVMADGSDGVSLGGAPSWAAWLGSVTGPRGHGAGRPAPQGYATA